MSESAGIWWEDIRMAPHPNRRPAAVFLALAVLAAAAAPAAAQDHPVMTSREKTDTIRVAVSGEVRLDYVYRSREITAFTDSLSNPNGGVPAPAVLDSASENTFEGFAAVRLDVELSSKVSGVVEVGSRRVEGDPPMPPATDPDGGILRWGGDSSRTVFLREAEIVLSELVLPNLQVRAGLSTWAFDVRGRGSAFAFQPRRSQTITRNLDSDGILNGRDDAVFRLSEAAWVDEREPVGPQFTWSQDGLRIDLVLLPAVIERGSLSSDESLYALDAWLNLDDLGKDSRVGLIAAIHRAPTNIVDGNTGLAVGPPRGAQFYTLGGGVDLKLLDGALEIFSEAYVQAGRAGLVDPDGAGPADTEDVDARGRAFRIGFEWRHTVGNPLPVWAGACYFHVSGDGDTDPADEDAGKFASYEGVNDLMILEDPYFGFDWDSNCKGFKVNAGARFSAFAQNDLEVSATLGFLKAAEDLSVPAGGTEDRLGNELDLHANLSLGRQVVIKGAFAYLAGSDLLEEAMGGDSNPRADDRAMLLVLGLDVTF